jgi:hypothetical protein
VVIPGKILVNWKEIGIEPLNEPGEVNEKALE